MQDDPEKDSQKPKSNTETKSKLAKWPEGYLKANVGSAVDIDDAKLISNKLKNGSISLRLTLINKSFIAGW